MTDFRASDPSNPATTTTVADPAVSPNPTETPAEDNAPVIEYGGRAYTRNDLIKKLTHADQHITTLTGERENDRRLLEESNRLLEKQINAADVLLKIKEANKMNDTIAAPVAPTTSLGAEDVVKLVSSQLKADREAAAGEANFNSCKQTLTALFGPDKVNAQVKAVADDAGYTMEEFEQLARTKPKAFLKMFPTKEVEPAPKPILSYNSQAIKPGSGKAGSGFAKANTSKERIAIYQARLKELGLE